MQKVLNSLAVFFLFLGLLGIIEFIVELYQSRIHLGLRFLLLPSGIGLLYRKELWRKFSLLVMYLFASVIVLISIAYFGLIESIDWFFVQLPPIDLIYAVLLLMSLIVVIGASIWILQHEGVKALFKPSARNK